MSNKSIKVSQKVKGTSEVKYSAEITSAPDNYAGLIELAAENNKLQQEIMLAVSEQARNRTLARLGSLDRAGEPLFQTIDFLYVMTEPVRKITAASMCTKLEKALLAHGEALQQAVEAGDFEQAAEVAKQQKATREQLAHWEEKRENERLQKAASRAANKDS